MIVIVAVIMTIMININNSIFNTHYIKHILSKILKKTHSNQPQYYLAILRRGALTISMLSDSTMLGGWCRPRRRLRRRKSSTIRLGNKRRGFCLASKPVVQWGVMMGPLRKLQKIVMDMAPNGQLIEAYYWSLIPFLRSQLCPLC